MHFDAHRMGFHMKYYSTFFVDNSTERTRAQEKHFRRLVAHCVGVGGI